MLSQTVEYALRAMVFLADQSPISRTTQQIAEATKVPNAYLSKVLQAVSRSGLVKSQRGLHGGFSLTRGPEKITILEVVNSVDPLIRIKECPLGISSHGVNLCPLHSRLDSATAMVEDAFSKTTLAEILVEPTSSVPLCPFPPKGPQIVDLE